MASEKTLPAVQVPAEVYAFLEAKAKAKSFTLETYLRAMYIATHRASQKPRRKQ